MARRQTFQQALVLTGLALSSISDGYIFGQMSGMINALRADDSPISLSEEEVSWIASMVNVTCIGGFLILIILLEVFSRKMCMTIVSLPVLMCWLMLYFANDKYTIIVSRVIVGIAFGGVLPIIYINISEYVAPNSRPFYINFIACGMVNAGTALGHILSLFIDWREVALLGIIPTALSAFIPFFWVESPYWLASRGRYEECETAYKALHGSNETRDEELRDLIQKSKTCYATYDNINPLLKLAKNVLTACTKRHFYNVLILLFVISWYRIASGRILLSTLAISMIEDITGSKDIFVYTLLFDGFALIGVMLACVFITKINIRPMLLISGTMSNLIQVSLSICLYYHPNSQNLVMTWVKIILLVTYFTTVTAGPYCVLETLLSEIHPIKLKGVTIFLGASFAGIFQFLDIKLASKAFSVIGYHGVFFFHSAVAFLCLIYMYFYLPETKGRTLQEIELYFEHNKFQSIHDSNLGARQCLHQVDREANTAVSSFSGTVSPHFQAPI